MHYVYMLCDETGRHYIGMTADLLERGEQHRRGGTQTTRRMHGSLSLVAARPFQTKHAAAVVEKTLKRWKNPSKAREYLLAADAGG